MDATTVVAAEISSGSTSVWSPSRMARGTGAGRRRRRRARRAVVTSTPRSLERRSSSPGTGRQPRSSRAGRHRVPTRSPGTESSASPSMMRFEPAQRRDDDLPDGELALAGEAFEEASAGPAPASRPATNAALGVVDEVVALDGVQGGQRSPSRAGPAARRRRRRGRSRGRRR